MIKESVMKYIFMVILTMTSFQFIFAHELQQDRQLDKQGLIEQQYNDFKERETLQESHKRFEIKNNALMAIVRNAALASNFPLENYKLEISNKGEVYLQSNEDTCKFIEAFHPTCPTCTASRNHKADNFKCYQKN